MDTITVLTYWRLSHISGDHACGLVNKYYLLKRSRPVQPRPRTYNPTFYANLQPGMLKLIKLTMVQMRDAFSLGKDPKNLRCQPTLSVEATWRLKIEGVPFALRSNIRSVSHPSPTFLSKVANVYPSITGMQGLSLFVYACLPRKHGASLTLISRPHTF